jgi:hypothetical protein
VHDILSSLREFGGKVARRWYALVVGVIGGVLGLVSAVAGDRQKVPPKAPPPPPLIPLALWLPLLVVGFLGAVFWAFHDVRMERDAARNEVKRRFAAQRYALQREAVTKHLVKQQDGTWSVQIGLRLKNNSDDPLCYEIERMNVVIAGKTGENVQYPYKGTVIPPQGTDTFRYPFVHSLPERWQEGSVEYTVRYGHPSAHLRFRKSHKLRLTAFRSVGKQPPLDIDIEDEPVSDSEVEDV